MAFKSLGIERLLFPTNLSSCSLTENKRSFSFKAKTSEALRFLFECNVYFFYNIHFHQVINTDSFHLWSTDSNNWTKATRCALFDFCIRYFFFSPKGFCWSRGFKLWKKFNQNDIDILFNFLSEKISELKFNGESGWRSGHQSRLPSFAKKLYEGRVAVDLNLT